MSNSSYLDKHSKYLIQYWGSLILLKMQNEASNQVLDQSFVMYKIFS